MGYPAMKVARYIVTYCNAHACPISNLKLQKILYFAWIDYYKAKKEYLFDDYMCAWQLGPVVPDVYYRFCVYGGKPITQEYPEQLATGGQELLDAIIPRYASQTVGELVNRTHLPVKPWDLTYRGGLGNRRAIFFSSIIELECK